MDSAIIRQPFRLIERMENPFEYILKERQEHERRLRHTQTEGELSKAHENSAHQDRVAEKHRYDSMVNEVLEQLRYAAYPSLKLHSDDLGWSIGMWTKYTDGSVVWYSALDVRLVHDLNSRAVYLECSRHNLKFRSEPSREDLILTLQRIFPPLKEVAKGRSPGRKKTP